MVSLGNIILRIRVVFFASVRELTGESWLDLDLEANVTDVSDVKRLLCQRNEAWREALDHPSLIQSVNHKMVVSSHPIEEDDEIAFFPPMTGG